MHRVGEQPVDRRPALFGRFVGEKRSDFFGRRQRADEIERDPAQEFSIRRRARGRDADGAELGVDFAVDQVGRGNLGNDDRPSGRNEDAGGRDQAVVGGDHGGVAGSPAAHNSRRRQVGDVRVPDAEVAERGDVGFGAVGESRDDRDASGRAGTFKARFRRPDLDGSGGGPRRFAPRAAGDPGADDTVFPRAGRKPPTSLVRHLPSGLQQDQAAVGLEHAHAAPCAPRKIASKSCAGSWPKRLRRRPPRPWNDP